MEYPTGPPVPRVLQVLALAPILALVVIQGALGILLAIGGVFLNQGIVRSSRPQGAKIALVVLVLAVILGIEITVVVAYLNSN